MQKKDSYPISATISTKNEIIDILKYELLDKIATDEILSFNKNPVIGVCYFRKNIFNIVFNRIKKYYSFPTNFCFADFGGGEGHLSKYVAKTFKTDQIYILDISKRYLELAPANLKRICCDIRQPIFEKDSLDLAALWVTLHHFNQYDQRRCLQEAYNAIKPGGALLIFEPNNDFYPRKILMHFNFFRKNVYFDNEEKNLSPKIVTAMAKQIGFIHCETSTANPPYSKNFISKLNFGFFYYLCTELFYRLDLFQITNLLQKLFSGILQDEFWGMYFLTILKKPN